MNIAKGRRKSRRLKTKQQRREEARLGGSAVARAAGDRPGGTHGRRPPNRRLERERAIQDSV